MFADRSLLTGLQKAAQGKEAKICQTSRPRKKATQHDLLFDGAVVR